MTRACLDVKKCYGECGGHLPLTTIAHVDCSGHVNNVHNEIFPKTFKGFHGRKFKVVTKEVSFK
jgi:hypothetical protein